MLDQLQRDIHYHFKQVKLLEQAITHSSYSNEQNSTFKSTISLHNERLEFLGDAVLQLASSAELYQRYPDSREGALTSLRSRIVSTRTLAELAKNINLERCLLLGKGEESQGGRQRDSVLADAFEAILGAVFLDGGFEAARTVLCATLEGRWEEGDVTVKAGPVKDNKSRLQEIVQKSFRAVPDYKLIESSGPEHEKTFVVRLTMPDGNFFESSGGTVKGAEQTAAAAAIEFLLGGKPPGGE